MNTKVSQIILPTHRVYSVNLIISLSLTLLYLLIPIFILGYIPEYGINSDPFYYDKIWILVREQGLIKDLIEYSFIISVIGTILLPVLWFLVIFLYRKKKLTYKTIDIVLISLSMLLIIVAIFTFQSEYATWFFD